jgi:hypothetical protein
MVDVIYENLSFLVGYKAVDADDQLDWIFMKREKFMHNEVLLSRGNLWIFENDVDKPRFEVFYFRKDK